MSKMEYTISFDIPEKSERIIRKFLLGTSNIVRLTEVNWSTGFFKIKRFGGEKDEKFIKTLNRVKPFFLKKITNNKRYNDIEQGKKSEYNHYYYRLSQKIKSLINEGGLLSDYRNSKSFYGFEDLTFYKNNRMVGSVITHEPMIILYLTKSERLELEKNDVRFD